MSKALASILLALLLMLPSTVARASEEESDVPTLPPDQLEQYQFERDPEELEMTVDDLSLGQRFIMQKQRLAVSALMARQLGIIRLNENLGDLDLIQRIVDEEVVAKEDLETWQALGVVLGDLLARELDLHWVQVEDELGVSKALQFKETQSFVFPVTMLSKRVQFGQEIDLRDIYRKVEQEVERFRELEGARKLGPLSAR